MLDSYYKTGTALSDGHDELIGWGLSPQASDFVGSGGGWWGWINGVWSGLHQQTENGADKAGANYQPGGAVYTYPIVVSSSWQATAQNIGYFNYGGALTNSGNDIPTIGSSYPIGGFLSSGGSVTYTWWRERLYPPNATMPVASFGALTCY